MGIGFVFAPNYFTLLTAKPRFSMLVVISSSLMPVGILFRTTFKVVLRGGCLYRNEFPLYVAFFVRI